MSTKLHEDNLGLYVHIPFCVRKCPYCDFNTFDVEKRAIQSFLSSLKNELRLIASELTPPAVDTVFIGGGTPTVLSGGQLSDVMHWIHKYIGIAPQAEVTVEANPGSVTVNGLKAMVRAGVNRVSLGVQSFSDDTLQRIGRNHTVHDVYTSYEQIRAAGIENVNFDLMFALPQQTVSDWEQTLDKALQLQPEHLSCYSLIIEEGTPFASLHARGKLSLPIEDDEALMYEKTIEACLIAGYEHYEISNFAKPGFQCRHNVLYWENKQWLAAGPGAHAYWQHRRYWNEKSLTGYDRLISQGELPVAGYEDRDLTERMDETVMLGLRLLDGVDVEAFRRSFDKSLVDEYGETIDRLSEWGLLEIDDRHMRLTPRGLMLGNQVAGEFLRTSTHEA